MKIDLRKLYALNKLSIDEEVVIPEEYYKNAGVRSLSKVKVNGDVTVNYEENIELHLNVSGEFIIPCAITLDDVIVPFNTFIEEEIDQNKLNDEFFLDLLDVLWENIVLEIPVRVVKEGVKSEYLHGEGWELVTKE